MTCAVILAVAIVRPTVDNASEGLRHDGANEQAMVSQLGITDGMATGSQAGLEYEPDVVLVELGDGVTADEVQEQLLSLDFITTGAVSDEDVSLGCIELALADGMGVEEAVGLLEALDIVESSQPNYIYHLQGESDESVVRTAGSLQAGAVDLASQGVVPNDPYASKQWALEAVNAYDAWDYCRAEVAEEAGSPVTVAILDSGMNVGHEDFTGSRIVGAYSFLHDDASDVTDEFGHGTHVAGIVAATADNGVGVAGVSYNAQIMPVQVIKPDGTVTTSQFRKGLNYVVENADEYNVRVVNISIGTTTDETVTDQALLDAIGEAHDAGLLLVYASGNGGANGAYRSVPCDYDDAEGAIGVISIADNGGTYSRSSSSNYNMPTQTTKDLAAPGASIYSTSKNGGYGYQSGTSMAAPHVSGIAALVFAANPDATAEDVRNILCATAQDLGDEGWDAEYGYGLVDAKAALEAAMEPSAPEPTCEGATRVPVGATAAYELTDSGSIAIKYGDAHAALDGTTLTGEAAGIVVLSIRDSNGRERSTMTVEVYGLSGSYAIQSALDSSMVLDISGGSLHDRGNLQLYEANGTPAQAFSFGQLPDGSFSITCTRCGKVLDVSGGSLANGANVQQYAWNSTNAQRWSISVDASNRLTFANKGSGMALDVAGGDSSSGTNVQQYTENSTNAQKWTLLPSAYEPGPIPDGVYRMTTAVDDGYALDVSGASSDAGANVQVWRANGTDAQKWRVVHQESGYYEVTCEASGKALDVSGASQDSCANVQQWSRNGTAAQLWLVQPNPDGSCTLTCKASGKVLDVSGGVAANGQNVWQYAANSTNAQKWTLYQY